MEFSPPAGLERFFDVGWVFESAALAESRTFHGNFQLSTECPLTIKGKSKCCQFLWALLLCVRGHCYTLQ